MGRQVAGRERYLGSGDAIGVAAAALEYWRLGAQARISKTYSVALDPNAPRRTTDHQEKVDRDLMTKITYRALMKFENIAENAARGRFPSDAPIEKAYFDYVKLRALIKSKNRWEEVEKARIMKAYETKRTGQ